ncbi:ISAs1 family transposase [Neolewinella aurantiaca]|uniref:ISAs1 family transposase n=1 Tax=Neolewinella aurantiaca TaxID=2602767 RepID=A0A5C7FC67_9BACT|nr:ISAs1 family transposase [Neolewinella aurantiaca]TXF87719.1 ISAs1 family transposase [Neolewinella aurantiaca]
MDQMKPRREGGDYAKIVVNCFAAASSIALGQTAVDSKSGETKGAVQLIESVDVKGKCISGDANFCNFDLMELIISKGADYLIALKGRNGKLLGAAKEVFGDEAIEKDEYQITETGHGREERRTYRLVNATQLDARVTSPYSMLANVIEVRRERRITRKETDFSTETHYYVTSLDKGINEIAIKIRQHWAVEYSLHHVLDVTFEEDASRMRKGNAATNLSLIRKIAMNYLMPGKSKAGIKKARMRAAFSDKRRSELFQV